MKRETNPEEIQGLLVKIAALNTLALLDGCEDDVTSLLWAIEHGYVEEPLPGKYAITEKGETMLREWAESGKVPDHG